MAQQQSGWDAFPAVGTVDAPAAAPPRASAPPMRQIVAPQPNQAPGQTGAQAIGDELRNARTRQDIENNGVPQGYRRSANGGLEPIPGGPADPSSPQNRGTPAAGYRWSADGRSQEIIPGGSADLRRNSRPLTDGSANQLMGAVDSLGSYERLVGRFQDDFAGTWGQTESTLQGYIGTGTPGQRDFWSEFDTMDNQLRHAIFGASLTAGEQAAWNRTTVNASMRPEEVRANMARRLELARSALARMGRQRIGQGYDPQQVRGVMDAYGDLLDPPRTPQTDEERRIVAAGGQAGRALATGQPMPSAPQPANGEQPPEQPPQMQEGSQAVLGPGEFVRMNAPDGTVYTWMGGDRWRNDTNGEIGPEPAGGEMLVDVTGGGLTPEAQEIYDRQRADLTAMVANAGGSGAFNSPFELQRMIFGDASANATRRGIGDTVTFGLQDEGLAALTAAVRGGGMDQELARQRAIDAYDEENAGWSRFGGQVLGAAALPFPAARTGEGLTMLQRLAPLIRRGAQYGGAYGAGSGEDIGERVTGGAIGAATGAAAPIVFDRAGAALGAARRAAGRTWNNLTGRAEPPASASTYTPEAVAQAAQAEGIPAARPIADPSARADMTLAETTIPGHPVVRGSLEQTRAAIEDRVGRFGQGGTPQQAAAMGDSVRGAVVRRTSQLQTRARDYYNRAAAAAGNVMDGATGRRGQATIVPSEMIGALDRQIADLGRLPNQNRALINYLQTVRRDLVGADGAPRRLSVQDLRNIRTNISGEVNRRSLGATPAERLMLEALDAGREDITRTLSTVSPQALRLYEQGDEAWRAMVTDRDQLLQRLVGGDAQNAISGEQVLTRFQAMMQRGSGDSARFRRVLSTMTNDERANFRATIIDRLGRETAEGPFSPARFLANTRNWSDDAAGTLFGREGRESLRNLELVARAFTDAQGSLNNSRSGFVIARQGGALLANFKSALGGAIGFAVGGVPGAVVGSAIGGAARASQQYLSARALMNPDVSQWLAQAARARNPTAARNLTERLGRVIERNPAISQELVPFRRYIVDALNDNAPVYGGRLAAEPSGDQRRQQQERPQ